MAKKGKKQGTLQLKYVRSVIGREARQRKVIRGLGFTRLNQVIERVDTPEIRGMVAKVAHLVSIVSGGSQS